MKIILDFDGVLFDTAYEAYIVSCLAYQEVTAGSIEINYCQFLEYRHLVGPAWNYKYIIDFLSNSASVQPKDSIANAVVEDYAVFEKAFFATRNRLKEADFSNWIALNKPYDFFFYIKKLSLVIENIYVVSTKDKESIVDILGFNGFPVSREKIFGANDFNKYKTKGNLILSELVLGDGFIVFIDDMKKHLESLPDCATGCLKIQPSWGYIDPRDVDNAKSLDEVTMLLESFIFQKLD
jgi:hypothetical protein